VENITEISGNQKLCAARCNLHPHLASQERERAEIRRKPGGEVTLVTKTFAPSPEEHKNVDGSLEVAGCRGCCTYVWWG
jgi:hypothetical protein